MPEFDGLDVCREISKSSDVPILFLSARDDEIDRVLGLEIGGDDYVDQALQPARTRRAGSTSSCDAWLRAGRVRRSRMRAVARAALGRPRTARRNDSGVPRFI